MKNRVIGIGGIFFKAEDPDKLYAWYERHLGIKGKPHVGAMFPWRRSEDPAIEAFTIWSIFPKNTAYFNPSQAPFMINYQVEDMDALLEVLRRRQHRKARRLRLRAFCVDHRPGRQQD